MKKTTRSLLCAALAAALCLAMAGCSSNQPADPGDTTSPSVETPSTEAPSEEAPSEEAPSAETPADTETLKVGDTVTVPNLSPLEESTPVPEGTQLPAALNPAGAFQQDLDYWKQQTEGGGSEADAVARLWYLGCSVYNVDSSLFSDFAEGPMPEGAPVWGEPMVYLDFAGMTEAIFTPEGTQQLLDCQQGGGPFIFEADGVYYHLGAYKTGFLYEWALEEFTVLDRGEDTLTVECRYRQYESLESEEYTLVPANMTLKKQDGIWRIQSLDYPEARH